MKEHSTVDSDLPQSVPPRLNVYVERSGPFECLSRVFEYLNTMLCQKVSSSSMFWWAIESPFDKYFGEVRSFATNTNPQQGPTVHSPAWRKEKTVVIFANTRTGRSLFCNLFWWPTSYLSTKYYTTENGVIGTKYEMKFRGEIEQKLRHMTDRKILLFPFFLPGYDVKRFLSTANVLWL